MNSKMIDETNKRGRICWLDLETTGLDPLCDQVLECGIIITDERLNEIARTSRVFPITSYAAEQFLDPVVREMHTKSGLLAECIALGREQSASFTAITRELDEQLATFIGDHCVEKPYLAGNSVGDFDRHFLRGHLIRVSRMLSHRSLNVSQFKVLADLLGFELQTAKKPTAHRALADLDNSILILREGVEQSNAMLAAAWSAGWL